MSRYTTNQLRGDIEGNHDIFSKFLLKSPMHMCTST
jgi:hypothetical protein